MSGLPMWRPLFAISQAQCTFLHYHIFTTFFSIAACPPPPPAISCVILISLLLYFWVSVCPCTTQRLTLNQPE